MGRTPGTPPPERVDARSRLVTFLLTDVEGSTRLVDQFGAAWTPILDEHHRRLRHAVERAGGEVFGTAGDAVFAAFAHPVDAMAAAAAAQRDLASLLLPDGSPLRVRMGLHTGEVLVSESGYSGLEIHRAARIAAAGWGGQILVSAAACGLVRGALPADLTIRDLGVHRLKDLSLPETLHQLDVDGLPTEFPPLRSLDATPNNLPTQVTSFVGREAEVAAVSGRLQDTRLLTLTGPGGTGKTRLALQVAAEAAHHFPDGVWFVPLATVVEPDLVASRILETFGLPETSTRAPVDRLIEHVGDRRLLVVLDNFEQVLTAAPLVAALLRGAPRTTILVTSRAPLHVYGEQEVAVQPLEVPATDVRDLPDLVARSAAVQLFVQRAGAVRPGFRLDATNAAAVAEIARRLDGLPLAIELAAARVKLLPPRALLDRLCDRLGLLAGGSRDLPTRQQTLRHAIAWSYDLLDDSARRLLDRLSVFADGATLEAVEVVCDPGDLGADVLDALGFLVDQSLLQQVEPDGEPRFTMLETIREYAAEQLHARDEYTATRARHAAYFLELIEAAEPHFTTRGQLPWLERCTAEHDNLHAALTFLVATGRTEPALRFVAAAWRFWQVGGHLVEGRRLAESALALDGVTQHPAALARAEEALGGIAYWQGDLADARPPWERSLRRYRDLGDERAVANALYNLSFGWSLDTSMPDGGAVAMRMLDEARLLFDRLGDLQGRAKVYWAMSDVAAWSGDTAAAQDLIATSIPLFRELDDPFGLGWALHMDGLYHLKEGDLDRARTEFTEALDIFRSIGDHSALALLLDDFSWLAGASGDVERSLVLEGAGDRVRRETGADLVIEASRIYDRAHFGSDLPAGEDDRLRARGRTLTIDEALALALGDGNTGARDATPHPPGA
jgi:predicted ATPase/class 3 adenylate cyclase